MSDIALSTTVCDLDLTGLQLTLLPDNLAVAQEIRIACRFILGEWALNLRVGINFFGQNGDNNDPTRLMGRKGITPDEVAAEFRRAFLSIPGVVQVDSISVTISSAREGTVLYRVTTDAGTVVEGQEALVIHG